MGWHVVFGIHTLYKSQSKGRPVGFSLHWYTWWPPALPVGQQGKKDKCPGKCSLVTELVFWKLRLNYFPWLGLWTCPKGQGDEPWHLATAWRSTMVPLLRKRQLQWFCPLYMPVDLLGWLYVELGTKTQAEIDSWVSVACMWLSNASCCCCILATLFSWEIPRITVSYAHKGLHYVFAIE